MAGVSACCVTGTIAQGKPTGTEAKLGGVSTYIAKPSGPTTRAIVICSDAFGYQFVNTRLIADGMAKEGFLAVVPDMFDGRPMGLAAMEIFVVMAMGERQPDAGMLYRMGAPFRSMGRFVSLMSHVMPFMRRHFPPTSKVPIFEAVIADLKAQHGAKSVGVIGYCFGGTQAITLGATDQVDAFAVAHGVIKVPQELEPLKKPGLIICADHDDMCPEKMRKEMEGILAKRTDVKVKVSYYPGTFHGFTVRGDDKDPKIAEAKVIANKETIDFFKANLKA